MAKAKNMAHALRPSTQRPKRLRISSRLTPKECQALFLVIGLFVLGFFVRWYRLMHVR